MGGGGATSGGTYVRINGTRHGDLPVKVAKGNSRYDLYIDGAKVQSRWFDHEGKVIWNRDYEHQNAHNNHEFPHDHSWEWHNGKPWRDPTGLSPDFIKYH